MGFLGDLNHSHPFVQQEVLNYVVDLVQEKRFQTRSIFERHLEGIDSSI